MQFTEVHCPYLKTNSTPSPATAPKRASTNCGRRSPPSNRRSLASAQSGVGALGSSHHPPMVLPLPLECLPRRVGAAEDGLLLNARQLRSE
jgi:hypothetical protein